MANARKRILYLHHGGAIGGAPLSLLFLLEELDRQKYEPIVLVTRPGPVVDLYKAAGVEAVVTPDISDFSHTELVWYGNALAWQLPEKVLKFWPSVRAMRRYIQQYKPDLVHLNASTLVTGAYAAHAEGVPVVWHIREPLAHGYFGIRRRWLQNQVRDKATRVVAISQNDANQQHPNDNIRVIHNFVDFEKFDHKLDQLAARKKLGLTPSQNVILMLGGSSSPKGTLPLIQALSTIKKALPNTRILIAGPKPRIGASQPFEAWLRKLGRIDQYDRKVMQAATEAIANGYVRFIGVRSDVPNVLAASDLLVFPSVVPHFARPVIEAAAMGKPVVASNLGGPQELVIDGKTGYLANPNDPQDLAEKIIAILKSPDLTEEMGANAYTFAREKFEAHKNAARTFAVYDEIFNPATS